MTFDEPWDSVAKKERNCQPHEAVASCDCGGHVALDRESRWVVRPVVGQRTSGATHHLGADVRRRTGGRLPWRITSGESPASADALRTAYGQVVTPPRTGKPGHPRNPTVVMPAGLTDATVHKERANGRVVRVSTPGCSAPGSGCCSPWPCRGQAGGERGVRRAAPWCRRNGREGYEFSKDYDTHVAATRFSAFTYHFGWPVRTLRGKGEDGKWHPRSPAMAAKLTDHVWTIREWITCPAV